MKKTFALLSLLSILFIQVYAQPCKCNPNGFNPFKYTYDGVSMNITDGHQFSVACKKPFTITGGYKCDYTTTICAATLKATIKNAAGTVIKSYESFSFPLVYEFETSGNYVLEITPYCLGKICKSVKFYFNVTCNTTPSCACNATGWDRFTAYIDNTPKPTVCGSTFLLNKTQKFGLEGGYKCAGNCNVKFTGVLYNTGTSTEVFNNPNFTFNWLYAFTTAGKYKLVITPNCNGVACTQCIYYFEVN